MLFFYYYECKNHRKKNIKCPKKNVSKSFIENLVIDVLKDVLSDSENLASLAVDVANYYKKLHSSDGDYLKSLKAQLRKRALHPTAVRHKIGVVVFYMDSPTFSRAAGAMVRSPRLYSAKCEISGASIHRKVSKA